MNHRSDEMTNLPHDWIDGPTSRRGFLASILAAGAAGALGGCAASGSKTVKLPGPAWPSEMPSGSAHSTASSGGVSGHAAAGVLARTSWAAGRAIPSRMQPMLPVQSITVHHTAGPVFYATDVAGTKEKIDGIRRYHQGEHGWGDVGYHYLIDRSGRVWEGRSLRWQGAHVRDHNEGNIGVVALGNFDDQQPTQKQLNGLTKHLRHLMGQYKIPIARIRTHQEWAPTACPGRHLQQYIVRTRSTL